MRLFSLFLLLILAALPAAGQTTDGPEERDELRRFEAEDVFSLEWAADPQVAPDGRYVAYVRTGYSKQDDRATSSLWMLDRDRGTHRPLVTERAASIVTVQPPVPEQDPPQPTKTEPLAADAVRVTLVPLG